MVDIPYTFFLVKGIPGTGYMKNDTALKCFRYNIRIYRRQRVVLIKPYFIIPSSTEHRKQLFFCFFRSGLDHHATVGCPFEALEDRRCGASFFFSGTPLLGVWRFSHKLYLLLSSYVIVTRLQACPLSMVNPFELKSRFWDEAHKILSSLSPKNGTCAIIKETFFNIQTYQV